MSAPADVLTVIDAAIVINVDRAGVIHRIANDLQGARATVAEMLEARKAMAPLCRAIVDARTEAEEIAACKALAKWMNDDLDKCLYGDEVQS